MLPRLLMLLALFLSAGPAWAQTSSAPELCREALARLQIDHWQERLADFLARCQADCHKDTLHLAGPDHGQMLLETLRWYGRADGGSRLEGMAVLGPEGLLVRQAAVVDPDGSPWPAERLAEMKGQYPWRDKPWLSSYAFIWSHFQKRPQERWYISPFLPAAGRQVVVMAAPAWNRQGSLKAVVLMQTSLPLIAEEFLSSDGQALHFWLADRDGNIGLAQTALAKRSAQVFLTGDQWEKILARGGEAAEMGDVGEVGETKQSLDGRSWRIIYRTIDDLWLLAVVLP